MFALQIKHLHPILVFAFMTNTPTLWNVSTPNADLDTQKKGITRHCTSTYETSIKLWWHTSIHQQTPWSPLSLGLRLQGALDDYRRRMIWHSVRKTHSVFQLHIAKLSLDYWFPLCYWLNRCTTGIPIHTSAFLPVGQEWPNMDSLVKPMVINNKKEPHSFLFSEYEQMTNRIYVCYT